MFLRAIKRKKDGKEHVYHVIVENKRVAGGRVVQRHVLYLGELNSSQAEAWRKSIEVFEDGSAHPRTMALFPEERSAPIADEQIVRIRLSELALRRPRQWGGCWLCQELYEQLGLDEFWAQRLTPSRKGTRWDLVLRTLVSYRFLDPGSEWRLHREWFQRSAMADLLGEDFALAETHKLYTCHDLLLQHKEALFEHLTQRWKDLFNAEYEVLLYDLTSTYFESNPRLTDDLRKHGYSRDKRPDCVQVVIGLVVTPEGFPLAYEVMAGNTSDRTTLRGFLKTIEAKYGKAKRIWVMDRGIPTEEILAEMRQSDPPVLYLVGTPKGRLKQFEKQLLELPWQCVRDGVDVKVFEHQPKAKKARKKKDAAAQPPQAPTPTQPEVYVLAQSRDRRHKERAMRRRRLKWLWARLKTIQSMKGLSRDELILKLGAAKQAARSAWRLLEVNIDEKEASFQFKLRKDKLRQACRHEGRYLLRSNLPIEDPARMWQLYMQLSQIEEAFKNLKGDLSIRPIHHQLQHRVEAHIFVAFMAYCLHVTLQRRLKDLAPGLTPRSVLEKFKAIQMIDVHLPTTDGREVVLSRYTQPEPEQKLLLDKLKLELPPQPPPRIRQAQLPAL